MRGLESKAQTPWAFFLLVFALSVPFWVAGTLVGRALRDEIPIDLPFGALQAVNPLLAALILVYREDGTRGVRKLVRRAADYRRIKSKSWFVPVFCLWPAALVLEYGFMYLTDAPLPETRVSLLMVPVFLVTFFVAGTCEELGWQGYAFGRLEGRRNALRAGLVLGAVWAAWHVVPLTQSGRGAAWIAWQCLGMVPFRLLVVWLYNNTGESVFAASMFHATANVSQFMFPNYGSHYDPFIAFSILTAAAAAVTILFGPETLARYERGRAPHVLTAGRRMRATGGTNEP